MNKLNILFVDDEVNILQGYKRILHSMNHQWNIFTAQGGHEALAWLSENHIDIIISDMRMPGIDGAQLLSEVKNKYPHVVRFILSGFTDKDAAIRASGLAHQVMAKPTDTELLKSTISKIFMLRNSFGEGNILDIVASSDHLPSQPELFVKLNQAVDSPTASIKSIGEIISRDPVMTAKILQLVNSAFFGLPHRILDPVQAVNFLGLDVIKSLVVFVKVFAEYKGENFPELNNYWTHSLSVGKTAQYICGLQGGSSKECETAFISGMLHDVGKLVLSKIPDYFSNVRREMNARNISFPEAEYLLWGTSHAEAGASLLSLWGLPQEIISVLSYHHYPLRGGDKKYSVLTTVYMAECFANGYQLNAEYLETTGLKTRIEEIKNLLRAGKE